MHIETIIKSKNTENEEFEEQKIKQISTKLTFLKRSLFLFDIEFIEIKNRDTEDLFEY